MAWKRSECTDSIAGNIPLGGDSVYSTVHKIGVDASKFVSEGMPLFERMKFARLDLTDGIDGSVKVDGRPILLLIVTSVDTILDFRSIELRLERN